MGTSCASRFWSRVVVQDDGCWLFGYPRQYQSYPVFTHGGAKSVAHRVSWEMTYGEIPDGMFVCHVCDVRQCVNPQHLFLGSPGDNRRDCQAKGRFYPRLHRLTQREVQQCRSARLLGFTQFQLMRRFGVQSWQIEKAQKGMQAVHGRIAKPRRVGYEVLRAEFIAAAQRRRRLHTPDAAMAEVVRG